MQLILLENIINLGKVGDQVKVRDGFGRNYLLKHGKALRASKENIAYVNEKKDELNKKNLEIKNQFKEIAKKINNKNFKLIKETKESGELYAAIKPKEIVNLISNETNISINPSNILIKSEIKNLGKFKIEVKFHSEVSAYIIIEIIKSGLIKK